MNPIFTESHIEFKDMWVSDSILIWLRKNVGEKITIETVVKFNMPKEFDLFEVWGI